MTMPSFAEDVGMAEVPTTNWLDALVLGPATILRDIFGVDIFDPEYYAQVARTLQGRQDAWTPPINSPYPDPIQQPPGWTVAQLSGRLEREGGGRGLSAQDILYLQTFVAWAQWLVLGILGDTSDPARATVELANLNPAMAAEFARLMRKVQDYQERIATGQTTPDEVDADTLLVRQQIEDIRSGKGAPTKPGPTAGKGLLELGFWAAILYFGAKALR